MTREEALKHLTDGKNARRNGMIDDETWEFWLWVAGLRP